MKSGHLSHAAVVSRSLDPYGLPWRKNAAVAFERAVVAFERERSHEHAGAPRRASSCGASVVRLSFSYRRRDGWDRRDKMGDDDPGSTNRKVTDVDGQRRPPYALPRHSIATIDRSGTVGEDERRADEVVGREAEKLRPAHGVSRRVMTFHDEATVTTRGRIKLQPARDVP